MKSIFIVFTFLVMVCSLKSESSLMAHQLIKQRQAVQFHQLQLNQMISKLEHRLQQDNSQNHNYQLRLEHNQGENVCSDKQIQKNYQAAIQNCEDQKKSLAQTVECIHQKFKKQLGQLTSIYAKQKNSTDGAYITNISPCLKIVPIYGKYGRTYYFWPAFDYKNINQYMNKTVPQTKKLQKNLTLNSQVQKQIKDVALACSKISDSHQSVDYQQRANCINKELKNKYKQQWFVFIQQYSFIGDEIKKTSEMNIYPFSKNWVIFFQNNALPKQN